MTAQPLRFAVEQGPAAGTEVDALWLRPRGAEASYVFAHGAGAPMTHAFMEAMAQALAERGVATLRYQFPYMQAGRRRPDRPAVLTATVRSAVALAARRAGSLPVWAGGKSMGGRMTSLAFAEQPLPGVRGLVFLGFPLHPAGKPSTDRAAHLQQVDVPMLFVQGTRDKLADLELLEPVVSGSKNARLHVIDDADHSLKVPKRSGRTDDEVRSEVADLIAGLLTRG